MVEELGCVEELPGVVGNDAPQAATKHGGDRGPGQKQWPGPGVEFCIGYGVFERYVSLHLKKNN